jgi:hypothetical protein
MPNNKAMAEARLQSLQRKLAKDPAYHKKYAAFMEKHEVKGYARCLTEEEAAKSHGNKTWFLPHHAVMHPQKPTKLPTKECL